MWYAASLQNCAFGATLSETLRDRVFFGMRDEHKGRPHFCQGAGDSGNSGRAEQTSTVAECHKTGSTSSGSTTKKGETVRPRGLQQVWRSA